MSKHLVTLIYGKVCGSAMRKAVLVAMADRANDDGSGIYVSKTRIAAELECSRETVRTAARELEDDGILSTVGKKTGRTGYTVIYQISVRNVQLLPDAWEKCPDLGSLDSGLGEDPEEDSKAPNGLALQSGEVPNSGGQSAKVIGKNRPYRTIDKKSFDPRKARSDPEYRREFDAPIETPTARADRLRFEAQRLRTKDPVQAQKLEDEASALLREAVKAERATEH